LILISAKQGHDQQPQSGSTHISVVLGMGTINGQRCAKGDPPMPEATLWHGDALLALVRVPPALLGRSLGIMLPLIFRSLCVDLTLLFGPLCINSALFFRHLSVPPRV
jgi:hypothetical protein